MTLPDVNWLDLLLILIIASSIFTSMRRGLTREVIGLVSAILGLFLGIWFYGLAGAFFLPYTSSPAVANFCGFAVVFGGTLLAGALLSWVIKKFLKMAGLSWADYLMGAGGLFSRTILPTQENVEFMVPTNRNIQSEPSD